MKTCKSCMKKIDEKAKKCPYCREDQRNFFFRHKIISGILVLFLLILSLTFWGSIAMIISTSTTPNPAPTPTPIADQRWIDDAGQRYFDNHKQILKEITLDQAKKTMESCIILLKDKDKCENVVEKKFWLGMSSDWATMSVGSPRKINRTVVSGLTEEQWVYGDIYNPTYLYFYNGMLKSYQN